MFQLQSFLLPSEASLVARHAFALVPDLYIGSVRLGFDAGLSTISHLLGHTSPTTTKRYAQVDLEMKRQAIAKVKPVPRRSRTPWGKDHTILDWLESL